MQDVRALPHERREELKRRYLAGEKYVVIEAEMGISSSTIRRYTYRLNLPARQSWRRRFARQS
jgi:DNA-directed RNA polymerase specialized sigma24 family protein